MNNDKTMLNIAEKLLSMAIGAIAGATAMWASMRSKNEKEEKEQNALHAPMYPFTRSESDLNDAWLSSKDDVRMPQDGSSLLNFEEDEIVSEQLTRNIQFFGVDGQRKIAGSFVVVIGLGGVGSHAAHLLLRSGVGKIRLVDFDQVTLSSLNRHCLATRADVGLPKAICLKQHFYEILPEAQVEAMVSMYTDESEEAILQGNPDFVLDAIDNIETKVALLAACKRRNLEVLSVAATGGKADPTRLRFTDISESAVDPLARAVRQRLRKNYQVKEGITMLLSSEKQRCGLIYVDENASANPEEYQVIPNFRVRTIPVLGTTPATFGLAGAAWILCLLAGNPIVPEPHFRIPAKEIQTQYDRLVDREWERKKTLNTKPNGVANENQASDIDEDQDAFLGVDIAEVEILIREIWRGHSARANSLPANEMTLTRGLGNLALTRWNPSKPPTIDNLILLTKEEANAHDKQVTMPNGFEMLRSTEPEFVQYVTTVLSRAKNEFSYRYY